MGVRASGQAGAHCPLRPVEKWTCGRRGLLGTNILLAKA